MSALGLRRGIEVSTSGLVKVIVGSTITALGGLGVAAFAYFDHEPPPPIDCVA
jgi:hypothetical protein